MLPAAIAGARSPLIPIESSRKGTPKRAARSSRSCRRLLNVRTAWSAVSAGTFYGHVTITNESFTGQGTYTVATGDSDFTVA